jgi:hypothetical protein
MSLLLWATLWLRVGKEALPFSQHSRFMIFNVTHTKTEFDVAIDGSVFRQESSAFEARISTHPITGKWVAKVQVEGSAFF